MCLCAPASYQTSIILKYVFFVLCAVFVRNVKLKVIKLVINVLESDTNVRVRLTPII